MIELSSLKPLNEAEVQIIHPTIDNIGESFIVYGSESKEYRNATHDLMLKRMSQEKKPTREELESDELNILLTSIKSFKGITVDGKELKSTDENIKKVLTQCEWIKDQVSSFVLNKANFFLNKTSKN